jgi:hypothetical protein
LADFVVAEIGREHPCVYRKTSSVLLERANRPNVIALRRAPPRFQLLGSDRALWPSLLDAVQVVQPETILQWAISGRPVEASTAAMLKYLPHSSSSRKRRAGIGLHTNRRGSPCRRASCGPLRSFARRAHWNRVRQHPECLYQNFGQLSQPHQARLAAQAGVNGHGG